MDAYFRRDTYFRGNAYFGENMVIALENGHNQPLSVGSTKVEFSTLLDPT